MDMFQQLGKDVTGDHGSRECRILAAFKDRLECRRFFISSTVECILGAWQTGGDL